MDDNKIIALYESRDQSAITKTSQKYGRYLTKISYNILSDLEDAQECVNDTYLRTWNSIPPQKPGIFSVFLARITRFVSLDLLRKRYAGMRGGGEYALSLIGRQSVSEVRKDVGTLWEKLYRDDSQQQSWLANSLWLSNEFDFDENTLKILRDDYYASAFSGVFGDKSLDDAYKEWLNAQTDGMLADTVQNKQLDQGHAAYIASTLYFNAQWENEYREENTRDGIFHGQKEDVTVPFMNRSQLGKSYYYCKDYAAISNPLAEGGEVIFILPDKDKSVDDVLKDSRILNGDISHLDEKTTKVNYSVPKLDISDDRDLADTLKSLDVTDVFNAESSDMSPLCKEYPLFVTAVEHTTRITVNEKGIRAAALGEVSLKVGAAPPEDEVDFVLDRPFVMVITGADNLPRFIAAVRNL